MKKQEQVFAHQDQLLNAMLDKNEHSLMELLHPEVSVFGSAIHQYEKGIDNVIRYYTNSLALLPDDRQLTMKDRHFTDLGDQALTEAEFEISFTLENQAITLLTIRQSALWILNKNDTQAETWLLLHDHTSMPDHLGAIEEISASELLEANLSLEFDTDKLREKLDYALENLKRARTQLLKQEKLAAVGQLAAGIAHEIKNPLNFVNNFAEVIEEQVEEVREEIQKMNGELIPETEEKSGQITIHEILDDITSNLKRIREHGERADSIVKSMLMHSRGKSGDPVPTDLNKLLDEHLKLSYHGMRAANSSFNVDIDSDYDTNLPLMEIIPQDLSRAFLNILNNAMYAAYDFATREPGRDPEIRVSTGLSGKCVVIKIRDNGEGIPKEIREQVFKPFFTTKPAGVGTGLGLSMTSEIVKRHNGTIEVDSEEGQFTEFIITIPLHKP